MYRQNAARRMTLAIPKDDVDHHDLDHNSGADELVCDSHGAQVTMEADPQMLTAAQRAPAQPDFSERPFTVIWEVTRACDLRCVHCRANAQEWRHPLELSTAEGLRLLEQVRELAARCSSSPAAIR